MGNCNCIRIPHEGSNINDRHPNTFVVAMIDERGSVTSEGTIKITATDLVLNRRGREDMWPLKSLRRYGADEDVFSFESGRRCPMGEGIFAFKCQRAQGLLEQLQQKLRNNTIPAPNPPPPPPSNPTSVTTESTIVPIAVGSNGGLATTANDSSVDRWRNNSVGSVGPLMLPADPNGNSELREYANVNCNGQPLVHRNGRMIETPDGYLVPNTPGSISQPLSNRSPGGISSISDTPAIPPKSVFSGNTFGQKFSFSESDKAMNNNDVSGSGGGTASGDQSLLAPPDAGAAELVYTQVTFDGHTQTNTDAATDGVVPASAPASSVNPAAPSLNNGTALSTFASAVRGASSDGGRGEYVQIDLERTEALRRTAEENHRTAAEREGERRTRHNSTLGEFLKDAVKRNSAS